MFKYISYLLSMSVGVSLYGLSIEGFDSNSNDRFANSTDFIGSAYNFSGVGISSAPAGGRVRWVTLLSNNVYITANHFAPAAGDVANFYETNDPNGPSIQRTISSNRQRIGNTDLFVGTLEAPVPSTYATYDILRSDIANSTDFATSSLNGQDLFLVGRSQSTLSFDQDIAVGRNVADNWLNSISAAGTTDQALLATVDPSFGSFNPFESFVQSGDSGAPVFIDQNGELTIAGINWFVRTNNATGETVDSGFSYTGNYDELIDAFVTANAVPEPRHYAMIFSVVFGVIAIIGRRRKK